MHKSCDATPQKENVYSKLLPYADLLSEEATVCFERIKTQLGKAVLLGDIKSGALFWSGQIIKFLKFYGYCFSKQDHISLIRLHYELTTTPDLEVSLMQKFGNVLTALAKKRELISRNELVLPWQPLYKLYQSVVYSSRERYGLQFLPAGCETSVRSIILTCRVYFADGATQEMLDEWRPLLCPFDVTMIRAMELFDYFLPICVVPEQHHMAFKLWFEEMMKFYTSCDGSYPWESNLVSLLSRLAGANIGYIDWKPYAKAIFTRVLRSFALPVGPINLQANADSKSYDSPTAARWVVAMINGDNGVLPLLENLLKALESYYHPSNSGGWTSMLQKFLGDLTTMMVKRVNLERYKKPSWDNFVCDGAALTDDQISSFVKLVKPIAFLGLFAKHNLSGAIAALHNLSLLRPELIVPDVLSRLYQSLDTLTEPHRLTATLTATVAVARSMVDGGRWYPEGKLHVLPILNLILPGIDANDLKKTMLTLSLIRAFALLVPFSDCSEEAQLHTDLSNEELELCSQTASFQDFVFQFMDRLFVLVDNSALDHQASRAAVERASQVEAIVEASLYSSASSVFCQLSPDIFKAAVTKLVTYLKSNVFEVLVSGHLAASLARAAADAYPYIVLPLLLPYCCERICQLANEHGHTNGGSHGKEERLDNELLWHMQLLSDIVRCDGAAVMMHADAIERALDCTLILKSKDGYEFAGLTLRRLLKSLVTVYPLEQPSVEASTCSVPRPHKLPIHDWGKPSDLQSLQIRWHVPSEEERSIASALTSKYLKVELTAIMSFVNDKAYTTLDRQELERRLAIILHILNGGGTCLKEWSAERFQLSEHAVVSTNEYLHCIDTSNFDITLNGVNLRESVISVLRPLLGRLLSSQADSAKPLLELIQVYSTLLFYFGVTKWYVNDKWNKFRTMKRFMSNSLVGSKRHLRSLLVERAFMQHELRVKHYLPPHFTATHRDLFADLQSLATSQYENVRKKAQNVLFHGFSVFPDSYKVILPDVEAILINNQQPDEGKLKGALYLVLGSFRNSMATDPMWDAIGCLWPALVCAQHSEKPSMQKLIEDIIQNIEKDSETLSLSIQVAESCIGIASFIVGGSTTTLSSAETAAGLAAASQRHECWRRAYDTLIDKLMDLAEGNTLQWKRYEYTLEMLGLLVRYDVRVSARIAKLFAGNLVNDSVVVRKLATVVLTAMLRQQKQTHRKVSLSHSAVGCPEVALGHPSSSVGLRWLQYSSSDLPDTQAKWSDMTFVEKTHWGYHTWPRELPVYDRIQPSACRGCSDMKDEEFAIFELLCKDGFLARLLNLMSLDDSTDKDLFRRNYVFFKGMFRNYGCQLIEHFKVPLLKLLQDSCHATENGRHRCMGHVVCGLIRGSKHWSFEEVTVMWDWLLPFLKEAICNVNADTMEHWGTVFSTSSENRDPRKLFRLFNFLWNEICGCNTNSTSLELTSRLYYLQGALLQQEWRVAELLGKYLELVKPMMSHPFKTVRSRIASLLSSFFIFDYNQPDWLENGCPKRSEFVHLILPQLEVLKETAVDNGESPTDVKSNDDSSLRKTAMLLCKTVLAWLDSNFMRVHVYQHWTAEVIRCLPLVCPLVSDTSDTELRQECFTVISRMSLAALPPSLVGLWLDAADDASRQRSWQGRALLLGHMQALVFQNMFTFDEAWARSRLRILILRLLSDEQLEVRNLASVTLSGALQCGYLPMEESLKEYFYSLSTTPVKQSKHVPEIGVGEGRNSSSLVKRHSGILGICACIRSCPYDVPDFLPEMVMRLSLHVHDPQPIQKTVKDTLSDFKRTHLDNWLEHKQKFSDDQLVVLTDLLVSQNYYA